MRPLDFNIRLMRLLTLWPDESVDVLTVRFLVRHILTVCTLCPSALTSILGAAKQLNQLDDINILLDHVIGLGALVAMVYMSECFIKNAWRVRKLVEEIRSFEERFNAGEVVHNTERNVQTFTKIFMLYGFVGNLCYALFPLFNIETCEKDRILEAALTKRRDPCGLIVRVWYPFDVDARPRFQLAYLLQMYTCIVISVVVLALTMTLVGLLMYAVALIQDCRAKIAHSCNVQDNAEKKQNVTFCSIMTSTSELFQVNIKLMRLLNLWPPQNRNESQHWRTFKDLSAFLASMPAILPIIADFVIQMQGRYDDVLDITENLTALGALFGMLYLGACFVQNRARIMALIERLKVFEEFGTVDEMFETEHRASLYTKMFIFYGVFGNLCYLAVPYVDMQACRERRAASRYSADIPCGLITRCRLPFDYQDSYFLYVAIILQLYACLVATMTTLTTTMFLVALLMQVIAQMQKLRRLLKENTPIRECIRYHNMINEYASHVTQAFSSMMLMHITLTSFEISVLGFEVLMVNSRTDSLRFAMHLFGWLVLLFLICSYGQKLIDESTGIGLDAYETNWYDSPVSVQKDLRLMILRSQKPLTLSAASLGVMSLETYLGVLSTAYSYFTLLLNMKKD